MMPVGFIGALKGRIQKKTSESDVTADSDERENGLFICFVFSKNHSFFFSLLSFLPRKKIFFSPRHSK
jgi:hypothetical protein